MINIQHLIRCCSLNIHAAFVLVSYLPSLKARKPVRKKRKEEPRDNRKVNNTFYLKRLWELDTSGVCGGVDEEELKGNYLFVSF